MNNSQIVLQASYEKINRAILEERWKDAYQACHEILRFDPENSEALRFKWQIEKAVNQRNKAAIKEDYALLKQLWREHRYQELLVALEKLSSFFPQYPKFAKLYKKAKKKYQSQAYHEREKNFGALCAEIEGIARSGDFITAIKKAETLRTPNFRDRRLEKFIQHLRTEWVDQEFRQHQALLQSDRYEEILHFLQGLKHIDANSVKVEKLLKKVQKKYQILKIESKKEFIYQAMENIRTLYQLRKFDKVIQASHEVLDIDPRNRTILMFQKKAKRKINAQIQKEILSQIISSQRRNSLEMKAAPLAYIKI